MNGNGKEERMTYETAEGEIVNHIITGKWDGEPFTVRYWFEYADGDVGSLPRREVRRRVREGEWSVID